MKLGEHRMRNRQLGISLTGLIVGAFILIIVALLGMKTLPPYLEYFTAKKLITQIANEQRGGSVADVKRAWQMKTAIESVDAINENDLEITKEAGEVVISFAYRKDVPLFGNVGVYFDFKGNSSGKDEAPQ
ncbi:MAG: DUF4845 domain-containing protein [Betaproteobacteria bacterium]|nr:DUF4845 domain-containing protein [Betaproteobacteria bacterium]